MFGGTGLALRDDLNRSTESGIIYVSVLTLTPSCLYIHFPE